VSFLGQSRDVGTKGCTSDRVTGNYVTTVAAMFGNRHWLFAVTVRGGTSDISKPEMNERSQTSVIVARRKGMKYTVLTSKTSPTVRLSTKRQNKSHI
jgi:chromosome condensin MukBEF MukE localization factor